jgi:putative ABC transport system substrate-binding protein
MAAIFARREIHDVPVVYTMVLNPEGNDLTGVNMCGMPLNGAFDDQLSVLAALRPEARRLLTIFDPRRLGPSVRDLRRAAHGRNLELEARPVRTVRALSAMLESLHEDDFDAFFLLLDPDLFGIDGLERLRRFTADKSMMLIVPDPSLVEAGGTFSYGPGFREMGAYAGRLIEQLFSGGAEPADLGRRFPTARNFTYNPSETQRLGITIPPELTAPARRGETAIPPGS